MPEELLELENTVEDEEGRSWVARVLGEAHLEGALTRAKRRRERGEGAGAVTESGT